jgi:hypothetical protein
MSEIEPRRRQRRKTLTDTMIAALPRRAGKTYYAPDPEMPKHGFLTSLPARMVAGPLPPKTRPPSIRRAASPVGACTTCGERRAPS